MSSAATNDTAPDHDRDWSGLQRAGFAVVLFTAAATLGFAAFTGPQEPLTAIAADTFEQRTEPATRGGGQVINGCTIQPGTQCRDADLRQADLAGANLSGASLQSADLHNADLSGANLVGADLEGARLVRADLHLADLTDGNLHRADLYDANVAGANLAGARLVRADLYGTNLRFATLRRVDLTDARFRNTVMPDGSRCTGPVENCSWRQP